MTVAASHKCCRLLILLTLVVLLSGVGFPRNQNPAATASVAIEAQFEVLLAEWCREAAAYGGGSLSQLFELESYREIVALGPAVVPCIVERIAETGLVMPLRQALEDITAVPWRRQQSAHLGAGRSPEELLRIERDEIVAWWDGGEEGVRREFERLRHEWGEQVPEGVDRVPLYRVETFLVAHSGSLSNTQPIPTEAGRTYLQVQALGIAVLPILVEEVEAGNVEWLPLILRLTDGAPPVNSMLSAEMRVHQVSEWWEANKQEWLIPWPEGAEAK